jgi:PAS domain S-box-containing protein
MNHDNCAAVIDAAQEPLRNPSRVAEAFFQHAVMPLVILDPEFNFVRVNEAYARACRRKAREFAGHNHFEFYPHAENEAIFRQVVRGKSPYRAAAKPFVFPDHPEWGTTYWDWTLVPILDAAGEVEFLVYSLNDVTHGKEAENRDAFTHALLELFARKSLRKEYLDSLVEILRSWSGCRCAGVRVADETGCVPYESYAGFSREFWELENRLLLARDTCACTRVIAQTPGPQDAPAMTPGGSFRCDNAARFVAGLSPAERACYRGQCVRDGYLSLAVIPIRYRDRVLGAIHLADEREGLASAAFVELLETMTPLIGEAIYRFSVEEQLRGAYGYARGLVEASLDPLVTINPQGEITDVNKATELATGVPRERLIGSVFSDYFTEPDQARRGYKQVISDGLVRDYPLTIRHASGRTTPVLYNATLYRNEAGEVQGVFAAARDITERKRAEERLQSLHEELAARARQLQTLASQLTLAEQRERRRLAQILHDHLQQLLYAARLNVGTLRRRTRDAELQGTIQQVDDVLNQCIMESRSLTVEISPPILYDVGLAAALEWLARHVQQTYGLAVAVEADPAAEPETEDMRVLLFQSVRELLFNVVKHAGVRHAEVTMSASSTQEVQITVADEGAGFEPADVRVGQWAGTGFGLFGIRERLELMGGRLTIAATPGQGTRVTIAAPRQRPAPPAQTISAAGDAAVATAALPAERRSPDVAGRIRVLLVDDHAIFRKGVADLLREEPAVEVVGEAADGEMAVDMALRTNPDVILMDVSMPRLGGIEATQRIVGLLPSVRIVGLSACEAENVRDLFRAAGATAYVSKTCHPETLIAAIRGASPVFPHEV